MYRESRSICAARLIAALGLVTGIAAACTKSAEEELHWYRGNTHAHSSNSDGDASPEAVARWYKDHGYQFLFITDHEKLTNPIWLNFKLGFSHDFLLLPGQEITQWTADPRRSSAHVTALFTRKVIWPMGKQTCVGEGCGATVGGNTPLAETFERNVDAVRSQHGIAQINHPNYRWSVKSSDLAHIPDGTLLEIWNGQGSIHNLGGATPWGEHRPSVEAIWDLMLTRGKRIWGVAADDSHFFNPPRSTDPKGAAPGQAWIMVRAGALSSAAIRASVEAGDFYSSTGVELTDIKSSRDGLSLTIRPTVKGVTYSTRFIGQGGRILAQIAGLSPHYRFRETDVYVRAAIIDSRGRRAWSQPVFKNNFPTR